MSPVEDAPPCRDRHSDRIGNWSPHNPQRRHPISMTQKLFFDTLPEFSYPQLGGHSKPSTGYVVVSSGLPPEADIPVASAELPLSTNSEPVQDDLHRRAPVPLKFSTRSETDRGRQKAPPPPRSKTPALVSCFPLDQKRLAVTGPHLRPCSRPKFASRDVEIDPADERVRHRRRAWS